jgi:hypothetical protein
MAFTPLKRRPFPLLRALWGAALLVAIATPATRAFAVCTYNPLANDSPGATGAATTLYTFTAPTGRWCAVGTRSDAGSNHDLAVFGATAPDPTCVQTQVGASATATGVDVVVGDFRALHNGAGPWYPRVTRSAGAGAALVEFDAGGDELIVDDIPIVRNSDQVIEVFDVFLEGGVSYFVDFQPSAGVDAKVLLFRNPGAGPYWAGRSARLLETAGPASFLAPASDDYALVVVNDDGGLATYSLAVDQCQPPIDLASGVPASTNPPMRYRFNQTEPYWAAFGVRGTSGEDWNLIGYKTGRGNADPECFKDTIAVSAQPGAGVDLFVGDFTFNPLSAYFARTIRASGASAGIVEWDDGPDEIAVGADPLLRATGAGDVLECWDVFLTGGLPYTIFFERSGAAQTKLLVFENAPQSSIVPYWTTRAGAVLTGTGHTSYTPAVTGYHGIVVVNDDGGTGGYRVGVYGAATGTGPTPVPPKNGITALAPNPAFARTTIGFTLARACRVGFDVLDVSGRLVARLDDAAYGAGESHVEWNARGGNLAAPPGVYFVRMRVDGRAAGIKKLILLP